MIDYGCLMHYGMFWVDSKWFWVDLGWFWWLLADFGWFQVDSKWFCICQNMVKWQTNWLEDWNQWNGEMGRVTMEMWWNSRCEPFLSVYITKLK